MDSDRVNNRTSDYVCLDCGKQFIPQSKQDNRMEVTFHQSICGLCGKDKGVTHIRSFNYLRLSPTQI